MYMRACLCVFMLRIGAATADARCAESCGTRSERAHTQTNTLAPYMITAVITAKLHELMFYANRYAARMHARARASTANPAVTRTQHRNYAHYIN